MATILLLLNLVSCGVIWAAAMYFYLRHGAPECAGEHYGQVALIFVAVGALATTISGVRGSQLLSAWEVVFRVGIAMIAARYLLRAWRRYRLEAR